MSYRTLIAAALFIPLSGCAVYDYDHDHGYRHRDYGHSHHYYDGYRRDHSPSVYVTPRYHYDDRHHDGHRYDGHRYDGKRYGPAPSYRHGYDQRQHKRQDGNAQGDRRRDDGRRHDGRQPAQQRHKQNFSSGKRQQQIQQGYSGDQRHSRGEQRRN